MQIKPNLPRQCLDLVQTQLDRPFASSRCSGRVFKVPQQRTKVDPDPAILQDSMYDPQECQRIASL